ncbi:RNA polymerase II-associated protein 3 [Drosophila rhopaloa]|uniref:RNA polymerase II-associated protein 3 n=1 Tax=Drosophila rhopaloa TaxID=1041015 RepID=A0A6P4E9P4_DRORH|nr:RNA polymerase II-associated protein 3 [Drosophila rhopaloa]
MSGAEKAFELQRQVRQNAKEYENSVKDLYSWERDIKSKEKELQKAPASAANKNLPVRSHGKSEKDSPSSSAASTPTEKQDLPLDPVAQQHKKANDIKDRGNNYVKQAEYDKAIVAYSAAIGVYSHDPIYFINRALCYLKQERFEMCVEDCEAAISLDKLCVKAYYRRMQANESLGLNMEALKDCTTVLAIEPKNIEAKKSLARINERLRKNATKSGPNFTPDRPGMIDILPFDKPVYKRSKKAMHRVTIVDVVSPRGSSDDTNKLRISDEDIDKIFNSNCGAFEEVKKPDVKTQVKPSPLETVPIVENSKEVKKETKQSQTKADSGQEASKETNKDTKSKADVKQNQVKSISPKTETIIEASKEVEKETKQSPPPVEEAFNKTKKDTKSKAEVEKKAEQSSHSKLPVEIPQVQSLDSPPKTTEKSSTEVKAANVKSSRTEKIEPNLRNNEMPASPLERSVPPAPTGTAQFHVTWKELSASQKYQYLKSIEVSNLCKILGAGFDPDTFADILRTVQDYYVPNKEPTTAAVLLEVSKNDQFTILAMLMSAEEKKVVSSIFNAFKNWPNKNQGVLDKLSKAYGVA